MEKAIQKAKEGGYTIPKFGWEDTEEAEHALILLDPLFWQALGKAEGWENKDNSRNKFWKSQQEGNCVTLLDEWENQMHNFIDHFIAKKPINSFFEELLK